MRAELPPLSTLRLFDAAGRHQSFKRAAEELNITPGAVSHGVAALERWIGARLFERAPGGLVLSPAGRDYLPYVAEALALIATGTHRLPRDGRITVTVSAAPTFAKHVLVPRLHRFRALLPQATVKIDTRQRQVSFPVDGVDFAIRMSRTAAPGLRSAELMKERLLPVCSPAFLAELPGGAPAARLSAATLLHVDSASEDWSRWLDRAGLDGIAGAAGLHFDTIQMAIDAAVAGLGIAIGRRPLVDRDLDEGRLVAAGAPELPAITSYWLVSHPASAERAELLAFEQWLISEMRSLA
ncbi:MAG: transcriptional regulator [Alphaproteobacteria bacterium]|nr:MAG: transcriptional regulator [Alphaproteobacteria bacterium]